MPNCHISEPICLDAEFGWKETAKIGNHTKSHWLSYVAKQRTINQMNWQIITAPYKEENPKDFKKKKQSMKQTPRVSWSQIQVLLSHQDEEHNTPQNATAGESRFRSERFSEGGHGHSQASSGPHHLALILNTTVKGE